MLEWKRVAPCSVEGYHNGKLVAELRRWEGKWIGDVLPTRGVVAGAVGIARNESLFMAALETGLCFHVMQRQYPHWVGAYD